MSINRLLLGTTGNEFFDLRPDDLELDLALSFINRIPLWVIKNGEWHAAKPLLGNTCDHSGFVGRL